MGEIRKGVEEARPKDPVKARALEAWLAGAGAGPVHELLGRRSMRTAEFPPIETPLIEGSPFVSTVSLRSLVSKLVILASPGAGLCGQKCIG